MPKRRDRPGLGLSRHAGKSQGGLGPIPRLDALAAARSLDSFDAQRLDDLHEAIALERNRAKALRSICSALTTGYRLLKQRITKDLYRSESSYAAGALGMVSTSLGVCLHEWMQETSQTEFPRVSHGIKDIIVRSGLLTAYSAACTAVAALEAKQSHDLSDASQQAEVPICPCCSARLSVALLKLWPFRNGIWPHYLLECDMLKQTVAPTAALAATAVRLWPSTESYLAVGQLPYFDVQDQRITQQCRRGAAVMGLELVHEVLSAIQLTPLSIHKAPEIFASEDYQVLLAAYLAWGTKHEHAQHQELPNTSSSLGRQWEQQVPPFHEQLLDALQLSGLGDSNPLAGQPGEPPHFIPSCVMKSCLLEQTEPGGHSSSAVAGMLTIQGVLQLPTLLQQQGQMHLALGPRFGSDVAVVAAALPGVPTKHYPIISLVVIESMLLHQDVTRLDSDLLMITTLVQHVGADPQLVMRCATVALRAALLLLAPVLHDAYKDWQQKQQGASVTAGTAALAAEAGARLAADTEREWALDMARKGAAALGIQQYLEGCLPQLFSTEPLPSNSWKQFSSFVCDMLKLIPHYYWSSVIQQDPCNSLAYLEAAVRTQAATTLADDKLAACLGSLTLPAAQMLTWECIPRSMALSISSIAVDPATAMQSHDTAAGKVHSQLLSAMLTGLKVLAQAPANHNNILGVAATAASAADAVLKLFPSNLRAAASAAAEAGAAQSSSNRTASSSAAEAAGAEYWTTWLTSDDGLFAAAPAHDVQDARLTVAANAGGTTPWLVLVGRSLLVMSSMVTRLTQGQHSQQTLHATPRKSNNEAAVRMLQRCSDAVAWVAAWLPAELPAAAGVPTQLTAAAEGCEQLLQKLADLQEALSSKLEQAQQCNLTAQQLQQESGAAAVERVWGGLQLPEQLQQLDELLCQQLPTPLFCNPGCNNLAKGAELQLARGKQCVCSGCITVHYCGRECQTAHWQQHKPVCKRLKARKVPTAVC